MLEVSDFALRIMVATQVDEYDLIAEKVRWPAPSPFNIPSHSHRFHTMANQVGLYKDMTRDFLKGKTLGTSVRCYSRRIGRL